MPTSLVFRGVELQVVCVAPDDKVPHNAPELLLNIPPYASRHGPVISKPRNGTQLRVLTEARGVKGEE